MLLILMFMLQVMNMQLVGVARDKVPKEESNTEPCHDLGAIQFECKERGDTYNLKCRTEPWQVAGKSVKAIRFLKVLVFSLFSDMG